MTHQLRNRRRRLREPEGPLGQDIDALLAEMNGDDAAEEQPAAEETKAEPEGPLGQDDIDALLAEMNGGIAPAEERRRRFRRNRKDRLDRMISMRYLLK